MGVPGYLLQRDTNFSAGLRAGSVTPKGCACRHETSRSQSQSSEAMTVETRRTYPHEAFGPTACAIPIPVLLLRYFRPYGPVRFRFRFYCYNTSRPTGLRDSDLGFGIMLPALQAPLWFSNNREQYFSALPALSRRCRHPRCGTKVMLSLRQKLPNFPF